MEKTIGRYSYQLGLLCAAIALVWRVLIALSAQVPEYFLHGKLIYTTFLNGGVLLFVVSIAAANYAWLKTQKD